MEVVQDDCVNRRLDQWPHTKVIKHTIDTKTM